MVVTESAKARIAWINTHYPNQHIRLTLKSGGCAGFSYHFDLGEPEADDVVTDNIHVDPDSYALLKNATVDYLDGFSGGYFKVSVPEAKSSCGCGKSIQLAA